MITNPVEKNRGPTISVVIPVRNAETTIGLCLQAVFSQSYPPFEVFVVDGSSKDKTVEIALKFPTKILYEDYGTVGGARQVGLENSNGDYVAFTDADCIPKKDWLENLVKSFTKDYMGVGGCIINIGEGIWEKSIAIIADTFLGSADSIQGRIFKEPRLVKSVSGCNSMYRRKDLLDIGGFNVLLSVNEETELNKRISLKGRLLYTPYAIIRHKQERGLKKFAKRMYQFGYGRGRSRLWSIHCVAPIICLCLLLSLLFTPWIALSFVGIYLFLLTTIGLKFAVHKKDFKYLCSIPATYIIEHFSYSVGFFAGIFHILEI